MATIKQKVVARRVKKAIEDGENISAGAIVESSGVYGVSMKKNPQVILRSQGVQEELENLGFDADSAKKVVQHILTKGKEENRLKAADMIFKVIGEYAPEKHLTLIKKIVSVDE